MAAADIDPMMMTAIKLLHSKSKNSKDQLKAMLDEALAQRRSALKLSAKDTKPEKQKSLTGTDVKKEADKRPFDKVSKAKSETSDASESKRSRVESPLTLKSRSSSNSSPDQSKPGSGPQSEDSKDATEIKQEKVEDDSEATDIEEPEQTTDAGEFALEMGLACVVCKQLGVQSGNQLVECQDCHALYHQECHKPAVTEQDISDPRFVWYCAKCTKTQKKITSKSINKPNKPGTMTASSSFEAAINQGKASATQLLKAKEKAQESASNTVQTPFKRTELKSPLPSSNNTNPFSQSKPIGLAGLAANISKTSTTTAGTSSSASSTTSANADKRLQMMKKKAAKANEAKKRPAPK